MNYKNVIRISVALLFLGVSLSAGEIILQYDFPEPFFEKVGDYDRVVMEGLVTMADAGKPMLPIMGARALLPAGERLVEVTITAGDKILLPGKYFLEPGQRFYPLSYTGPYKETLPDENIYSSDVTYPDENLKIISVQKKWGYNILLFNLFPVEYIPATGELSYYRNMTVTVSTVPDPVVLEESKIMIRKDRSSKNRISSLIDNPVDILSYESLNKIYETGENRFLDPSDSCGYVIITNQALSSYFSTFAEFKNRRGIKTRIKNVEDIYSEYTGNDNQEKIRNFIIDAYLNWGIRYVLLGGDEEIIPHRGLYDVVNEGSSPTVDYDIAADLYYSGLDGNWNNDGDNAWGESGEDDLFMEVTVGRAAVANMQEVNRFVSKNILYQDFPVSDECVEALMVGEDLLWNWGKFYKEEIRLGSSTYGYTTVGFPSQFNVQTLYDYDAPGQSWPVSQLISYLNGGVHLVNHLGHANVTYVMKLYNDDVLTSFTNDGVNHSFFIIYTQGCYANSFDNRTSSGGYTSDAISEHFTTKIDEGAVAFLGNSRYGWAQYSPSTDGPDQRFDRQFFDAIFGEDIYKIGNAQDDSKEDNICFIDEDAIRWAYYTDNLLGDPEMDIWTNVPESLYVTYPSVIPVGNYGFLVTVTDNTKAPVEGALVCVMGVEDTLLYAVGETGTDGSVTLLTYAEVCGDTATVTVTAHDYFPYIGNVTTIVPCSIAVNPGIITCGECTDVTISVFDTVSNPMEGIIITIDGYGVSETDTTDEGGFCNIPIYPLYGEILSVMARPLNEPWYIGRDSIIVIGGVELTNPDIYVQVPLLSIIDTLVPNIEGFFITSADEDYLTLFISGCGLDTTSSGKSSFSFGVTPITTGIILATIGKEGYNLYQEDFPVINLYGTISGIVRDSETSNLIGGASVQIYREGSEEPIHETVTEDDGSFSILDSLTVGPFFIRVMGFGYQEYNDTLVLLTGLNSYDIEITPGNMVLLSGVVNLRDRGDNSGVMIEARYEDYTFTTVDDSRGVYTVSLPPGALYTVRAYMDGYTEEMLEGVSVPQSDVNFTLYPVTTLYSSDFEKDDGGMTGTSDWQWGVPTSGPSSAYSGEKLWATRLSSNYSNYSDSRLTTSEIILPDASYIELSFCHWYSFESYYDGGNVKIATDGSHYNIIEPVGGYPEDEVSSGNYGIPGEPAYSGNSSSWEVATFDISSYAGDTVNIRLHFGSDTYVTEPGWYVDDVWVGYVDSTGIHDVGVLSIDLPDSVNEDSSYIPSAGIYNYGFEEIPFPVVCEIGDYIDTVFADVPQGERVAVSFDEWIPGVRDTLLTAKVETRMRGDWAYCNNTLEIDVYVYGLQGISSDENKPRVYALYQGRPNPFGANSIIRYAIPRKGEVLLEVYNVLGQKVVRLDSGVKEAGYYDVKWDGKDSSGRSVSGGIYFVKFSSGDYNSIKKLVKIR